MYVSVWDACDEWPFSLAFRLQARLGVGHAVHFAGSVWDAQLICGMVLACAPENRLACAPENALICLAFAFSFCGFRVEESIAISRCVCIYICIRKHIKVCIHIYYSMYIYKYIYMYTQSTFLRTYIYIHIMGSTWAAYSSNCRCLGSECFCRFCFSPRSRVVPHTWRRGPKKSDPGNRFWWDLGFLKPAIFLRSSNFDP